MSAVPEFAIRYGGEPLLLDDADRTVSRWIDEYLDLDGLGLFAPPAAQHGERANSRHADGSPQTNLARPNWPVNNERTRINTLYWPTGASRWSYGVFIVKGDMLSRLYTAAVEAANPALEFIVYVDGEARINTKMYALPPQPLSNAEGQPVKGVGGNYYLLPLVDRRYFWQWRDCGDLSQFTHANYTWNYYLTTSLTNAGLSGAAAFTVDANKYHRPDPEQTFRRRNSIGLVLDSIASSCGGQIVVYPDTLTSSYIRLARWEEYYSTRGLLPRDGHDLIAGFAESDAIADTAGWYPETFRVVFPKYKWGRQLVKSYNKDYDPTSDLNFNSATPDYDVADVGGDSLSGGVPSTRIISGMVKTIYAGAFCNVSEFEDASSPPSDPDNDGGTGTPANVEVTNLGRRIARDALCRWVWRPNAQVLSGVVKIDATIDLRDLAQADRVEWHLGEPCDGGWKQYTRWVGLPPNFGPDENLCQFDDTPTYSSPALFNATEDVDITPVSHSYNATLLDDVSNESSDTFYARLHAPSIFTGSGQTIGYWNEANQEWQILNKECN